MLGNISAYEWFVDGSQHIVYQTNNNQIHEIVGGRKGDWSDRDITREAGGPVLENAQMAGFAWQSGRTQQIAYVSPMDEQRQIHELVRLQNHNWTYEKPIPAPPGSSQPSNGLVLAGYEWQADGSKQIVYMDLEGHIHELTASQLGMWHHTDLTARASAPPAEATLLCAFACEFGPSKHVAYISGDGHVQELKLKKGATTWTHTDLTERTGAPLAQGSTLAGFSWEHSRSMQIFYTGDNGNIYELSAGMDTQWRYTDLMNLTGAPLVSGNALSGCVWGTGNSKIVVYVSDNQQIQEIQADARGNWTHTNLTQIAHAPGASDTVLVANEWSSQFAKQITYLDLRENPALHTLTFKHGEQWKHADLTALVGAELLV